MFISNVLNVYDLKKGRIASWMRYDQYLHVHNSEQLWDNMQPLNYNLFLKNNDSLLNAQVQIN